MKKTPAIMQSAQARASGLSDRPQWLLDRLEWFQDLKLGVLLDWGPHGQWGCNHWPIVPEDTGARPDDLAPWIERGKDLERFRLDYWALNRSFNPTRFDPAQWAELIWAAGMRYAAFTTKFHYGFCMFDWMSVNAEAIYETRPIAPYKEGQTCFTERRGTVYACVLSDGTGRPPDSVTLRALRPEPGSEVFVLGRPEPLHWQSHPEGAHVPLPADLPCDDAWVLRFRPTRVPDA